MSITSSQRLQKVEAVAGSDFRKNLPAPLALFAFSLAKHDGKSGVVVQPVGVLGSRTVCENDSRRDADVVKSNLFQQVPVMPVVYVDDGRCLEAGPR